MYEVNAIIENIDAKIRQENHFTKFLEFVDKEKNAMFRSLEAIFDQREIRMLFVLKISNLLVAKYQFLRQHTTLVAKPFGLLVDTANGCNLYCPGCVHSKGIMNNSVWPKGMLTEDDFRCFIENLGPCATDIFLYNWGEPLINKQTPAFIRLAKKYLLRTAISTNLSLRIDPEEIVTSGLDYMTISLDGATKESYLRFRKGGDFDLVIENIKKIIQAKQKFKRRKPYIQYRFLLFEHNKHEIELAKQLAKELFVDELNFVIPFDVSWDDPSIIPAKSQKPQQFFLRNDFSSKNNTDTHIDVDSNNINTVFSKNWYDLYNYTDKNEDISDLKSSDSTCHWLYKNLVMDAQDNILACCIHPTPQRDLTFAHLKSEKTDLNNIYNTEKFKLARQFFSDHQAFEKNIEKLRPDDIPHCAICKGNNDSLTITNQILRYYLDEESVFSILSEDSKTILSIWE